MSQPLSNFRPTGFNFGGWISQSSLSDGHVRGFLTEEDFKTVAQWGFNSVRLPVDGPWLFEKEGRGSLDKDRLAFLLQALDWAGRAGLLVVLDLHQVPWHSFGRPELDNLWKNSEDLGSFCRCWAELARALKGVRTPLWFDTLNEPTARVSSDWTGAARKVNEAIRSEDRDRTLMVESAFWGAVFKLEELVQEVPGDNLVYSFHFYFPMFVTHQGAPWWLEGKPYGERVLYPGPLPKAKEYLAGELPPETRRILSLEDRHWDRDALRELLEPVEKLAGRGHRLYCGEFGVFEKAPRETRLNWTRDVVSLLKDLGVGWAYWNYKWLDFGIWPQAPGGKTLPLDREMLQILQKGT